ncbi:hypothetical protein [Sphingopyxis witflariensis]|uniref:Uncharacterized protein n=1 Tax=Sphingopyxis witflariensis TaxID=173675 RepID=A0A2D0AMD0_9SPHN|nr:hypothetical protein [Sphingopyxis witflariensis]OWQ94298.1 hypothetical protein CDQ91_15000 [Sphingopyxis witflariensis]
MIGEILEDSQLDNLLCRLPLQNDKYAMLVCAAIGRSYPLAQSPRYLPPSAKTTISLRGRLQKESKIIPSIGERIVGHDAMQPDMSHRPDLWPGTGKWGKGGPVRATCRYESRTMGFC